MASRSSRNLRRPEIYFGVGVSGQLFLASPANAAALSRASSRALRVSKARTWDQVAVAVGGHRDATIEFGELLDQMWEDEGRESSRKNGEYPHGVPNLSEWIDEQGRFSDWEVHDDLPREFLGAATIEVIETGRFKVSWKPESLAHLQRIAEIVGCDLVEAQEFFVHAF